MAQERARTLSRNPGEAAEEQRRIHLSKYDTHYKQRITWEKDEDGQAAEKTLQKMSDAFSTIIECVGDPLPDREGLKRTPMRAAKALCFFTKGYEDNLESEWPAFS